jgi:hypothetical protein
MGRYTLYTLYFKAFTTELHLPSHYLDSIEPQHPDSPTGTSIGDWNRYRQTRFAVPVLPKVHGAEYPLS